MHMQKKKGVKRRFCLGLHASTHIFRGGTWMSLTVTRMQWSTPEVKVTACIAAESPKKALMEWKLQRQINSDFPFACFTIHLTLLYHSHLSDVIKVFEMILESAHWYIKWWISFDLWLMLIHPGRVRWVYMSYDTFVQKKNMIMFLSSCALYLTATLIWIYVQYTA